MHFKNKVENIKYKKVKNVILFMSLLSKVIETIYLSKKD